MQTELVAYRREKTGKGPARQLRMRDLIPAILYGYDTPPTGLYFEKGHILGIVNKEYLGNVVFDLTIIDIDGKQEDTARKVLIKSLQRDPITDNLIHLDLFQVSKDRILKVKVPLKITGTAKGITEGTSIIRMVTPAVTYKCLYDEIPEYIEVNVDDLEIGKSITVNMLDEDLVKNIQEDGRRVLVNNTSIKKIKIAAAMLDEELGITEAAPAEGEEEGEGAEKKATEEQSKEE